MEDWRWNGAIIIKPRRTRVSFLIASVRVHAQVCGEKMISALDGRGEGAATENRRINTAGIYYRDKRGNLHRAKITGRVAWFGQHAEA
ncbi:hypothetical protein WN51_05185 [Melipona quadrifasciata]|uniref:Uncharacterized protein n=1 Tax=Melipona quadrifasciata TaxID=166423 RepID=A0A0M8ZRH6_9HYME|nr:hypothetical protein WN51_05185 [Melipona quadrifasciata]